MFRKNKKKVIFIRVIILLLIISSIRYVLVGYKRAVFPWEAWFLRDNEDYFIVHNFRDWGEGGYYYWNNGVKVPIYIANNNPCYELAPPICSNESINSFLIRGYIDEEMSETAGKEVLWAEEWDIIAPIIRGYHYDDDRAKPFRPIWYFDEYDVETELYQEVIKDVRALEKFEAEHIQQTCGMDSCLVTVEYCDGELQWYMMDEWIVQHSTLVPITVQGFDFEKVFGKRMLSGCNDSYLLCGKYEEKSNVFIIEEWYIVAPIYGKVGSGDAFNYYSEYYFTKEDVEQGNYIPCNEE